MIFRIIISRLRCRKSLLVYGVFRDSEIPSSFNVIHILDNRILIFDRTQRNLILRSNS